MLIPFSLLMIYVSDNGNILELLFHFLSGKYFARTHAAKYCTHFSK